MCCHWGSAVVGHAWGAPTACGPQLLHAAACRSGLRRGAEEVGPGSTSSLGFRDKAHTLQKVCRRGGTPLQAGVACTPGSAGTHTGDWGSGNGRIQRRLPASAAAISPPLSLRLSLWACVSRGPRSPQWLPLRWCCPIQGHSGGRRDALRAPPPTAPHNKLCCKRAGAAWPPRCAQHCSERGHPEEITGAARRRCSVARAASRF